MTRTSQSRPLLLALALSAAGVVALSACGPALDGDGWVDSTSGALRSSNGMSQNGMSQNGMSQNGMSQNGLSYNGLDVNGLGTKGLNSNQFSDWFNQSPDLANQVMTYAVLCAYRSGSSLSWTNRASGISYAWAGNLGLAPVWTSGKAIPVAEQQLVTACLASHVNKFGVHLPISLRGFLSDGRTTLALDATEARDFGYDEACFFGNLFAGQGVYLGADQSTMSPNVTTPRGCSVEAGVPGECSPIVHAGMCKDFCSRDTKTGLLKSCTAGGVTYKPLQTFLQDSDVYRCGDGVCQFTEQPYDPVTKMGCNRDCGSL